MFDLLNLINFGEYYYAWWNVKEKFNFNEKIIEKEKKSKIVFKIEVFSRLRVYCWKEGEIFREVATDDDDLVRKQSKLIVMWMVYFLKRIRDWMVNYFNYSNFMVFLWKKLFYTQALNFAIASITAKNKLIKKRLQKTNKTIKTSIKISNWSAIVRKIKKKK